MLSNLDPDNFLKHNIDLKLKIISLIAHSIFLWWCVTSFSLPVLLYGILFYVLIGKTSGEIGTHRYFAHRSFKTYDWAETFFLFGSTIIGIGSSLSWSTIHRYHHKHADEPIDIHSPIQLGLLRTWSTFWGKIPAIDSKSVRDLIRNKKVVFFHKNYFKILLTYIFVLLLLSYIFGTISILMIGWVFTFMYTFHTAGAVDGLCHLYGYRNYDTSDNSRNNLWLNSFLFGSGLHNNHHGEPGNWNFSRKWYEVDMMGSFVKYIFLKHDR